MRSLTQKNIYNLPLHDSKFLGYKIFQKDRDFTEINISFVFCDGEYEDLKWNNREPEKYGSLIIQDCMQINSKMICDSLPPGDALDYVDILSESPLLDQYSKNLTLKHIKVIFISGSQLECIAKDIFFQFGSLL